MKKNVILKNTFITFLLINALFISVINVEPVLGDVNNPPKISDINDQTINKENNFNLIHLDNFVEDDIDQDENITWSYFGNAELIITIVDRVVSITTPNADWIGEETITFRATDTGGLFDEDIATFRVSSINNPSNEGGPIRDGGAIWTTRDNCGDQQQYVNEYCYGDIVYINGANFNSNVELNWSIAGSPNSCDPNTIIVSGNHSSGDNGSFCFLAYTIQSDDCGGYQVNVEDRKDNYNVIIRNYPPVANDDYATVIEGGIVAILDSGYDSILDNDTDPDSNSLSASLISGPSYSSSFTLNPNGTFSYTHDGSETVSDSFVYNASGPSGAYDHAAVTITINPQNDSPVADFSYLPSYPAEDDEISFSDKSTDPDGDIVDLTWDFEDGSPSWPTNWTLLDRDKNEGGTNNDFRDIQSTYFNNSNDEYLFFRMKCYGYPDFTLHPECRYKWFIDTDEPPNMVVSGGNVYEAEYLLFVEDTPKPGGDGIGDIYLLNDVDGDGRINDDWPDHENDPGPINDTLIANYSTTDHNIFLYINRLNLSYPNFLNFTWATDQENPNLDQAPNLDRPDIYVNTAPDITTIDVNTTLEDVLYSVGYNATDADGDVLTWSLETNATFLTIDSTSGLLSGLPENSNVGSYYVNVSVNDGFGGSDFSNFTLTVLNVNDPPVALDDYATVDEGGTVEVLDSGETSVLANDSDPDGDSFNASLISGPSYNSSFTLNPDGTFSYTHDGSETVFDSFVYNASDPYGAYDHATVTITINPQNDPPVANFSYSPIDPSEGELISFSDESSDPDGDIVSWSWDFGDGNVSSEQNPENTYSDNGTYEVWLTVTDDDGDIDSVSDDVVVGDLGPSAVLTGDEFVDKGEEGTYNASDSSSYPDKIMSFEWDWNYDGITFVPSGDLGELQLHSWDDEGSYVVAVRVTDDDGSTDIDTLVVTVVNAPPEPPTNPDPEDGETGINLSPVLSVYVSDPNGDVLNVSFYDNNNILIGFNNNVESGTTASIVWSGLSYSTNYYWYAIANDSEFNNKSNIWSFTTKGAPPPPPPGNKNPVADASAGAPYFGVVGEDITFDGSLSSDSDGYIVSWHWDFDNGADGTGEITTHNYSTNGTYHASLTVTDDDGAKGQVTFDVIISTANNPPENIIADGPLTGKKNIDYTYTASATDSDTDDMLRYIFKWGDGTTTTSEVVASGITVSVSHNWSTYGEYEVTVTAEDNFSAINSITFTALIDVIVIDGDIKGYIIDEDSTDPFDIFNNSDNGEETDVEKESTGAYLIDSDGDGEWDHAYDPEFGLLTYPDYVYKKYYKVFQVKNATPGFELISLLVMIALVTIILKRRRKK